MVVTTVVVPGMAQRVDPNGKASRVQRGVLVGARRRTASTGSTGSLGSVSGSVRSSSRHSSTSSLGSMGSGSMSPPPPPTGRISVDRDRATIDAFAPNAHASSAFANAYLTRALGCTLMHGSVVHRLQWDVAPEDIGSYDPLLALFAEGLVETKHPYFFVARTGFSDLLRARGAGAKAVPVLQRVVGPIRSCFRSSDLETYRSGLTGLADLSHAVGSELTPYLKLVIGQLAKNATKHKLKDHIAETLNTLELNGGEKCYQMIKAKVPTYTTCSVGTGGTATGRLGIGF